MRLMFVVLAVGLALVGGCASGPSTPAAIPSAVDCEHPPDAGPATDGAVEMPVGSIVVGYREWRAHVVADDTFVVARGAPASIGP